MSYALVAKDMRALVTIIVSFRGMSRMTKKSSSDSSGSVSDRPQQRVICPRCNRSHTLEREITFPQKISLVCHDCELHTKAYFTQTDIDNYFEMKRKKLG